MICSIVAAPGSRYIYRTLLRQNRDRKLERLRTMRFAADASGSLMTTVRNDYNALLEFELQALSYEYLRRLERRRIMTERAEN